MRTGIGYDIHPLVPGRPLILGGVRITHDTGLDGHSDGDALVHAIIDALLGAASLGDIGQRFPPDDDQYQNADSVALLRQTVTFVHEAGFSIANVDSTVIAEAPRIGPHTVAMREAIASALGCDVGDVSVKATTSDRLGATGRGEGIAALAIVLLDST